jgi:hypothetical protein
VVGKSFAAAAMPGTRIATLNNAPVIEFFIWSPVYPSAYCRGVMAVAAIEIE